jgi:uncharacterized phiE125 gp8 family phage protein
LWSLETITPAAALALTEAQAREHSRIDAPASDPDLTTKVKAAIAACEGYTGRQLVTATLELRLSTWCEPGIYRPSGVIRIPAPPLQSVSSVKYLDEDGADITLAASAYVVSSGSGPKAPRAELFPAFGTVWPTVRVQPASIRIRFVAGYGASETTVPPELTQGMLLWFGESYERREEATVGTIQSRNQRSAEDCWHPYRADF